VGWVHFLRGEYSEALPHLENAVKGNPKLPELRYHLGMTYLKLGRVEEARPHLEMAAGAADPDLRDKAGKALNTLKASG